MFSLNFFGSTSTRDLSTPNRIKFTDLLMEALWLKPLSFWALFFLPLMAQVYKNNTLRKEKIKLEFFIVIIPKVLSLTTLWLCRRSFWLRCLCSVSAKTMPTIFKLWSLNSHTSHQFSSWTRQSNIQWMLNHLQTLDLKVYPLLWAMGI